MMDQLRPVKTVLAAAMMLATVPVLAAPKAAPAPKSCDEACLSDIAERYLASFVAHDPTRAPIAPDAVIVENLQKIKAGEGFWKTAASVPASFKIVVPDAIAQQIAVLGVMTETQGAGEAKPVEVGIRLKIADGKVIEAEHLVVHELKEANLKNLQKARAAFSADVPEPYRDSRSRLLSIGAAYYDALDENNGRLAPFAPDCVRRENGFQTARLPVPEDGNPRGLVGALTCEAQLDSQAMRYITKIDNRRVPIANERLGLVVGFSHFHHDMKEKEYRVYGVPGAENWKMDFKPFDLPAMHIYKVWNGQIHEIEAIGYVTAYNSPTGW